MSSCIGFCGLTRRIVSILKMRYLFVLWQERFLFLEVGDELS